MLSHKPNQPGEGRYVYSGVQLVRAVDGDTLILRFPLPFNTSRELDVRLLGINTPEVVGASRAEGLHASAYLTALLNEADALIAQTFKTDKYGRYVAAVWRRAGGVWRNVSQELLDVGVAVPYPALSRSGGAP